MTLEQLQEENNALRCTLTQKEGTILSLEEQLAG